MQAQRAARQDWNLDLQCTKFLQTQYGFYSYPIGRDIAALQSLLCCIVSLECAAQHLCLGFVPYHMQLLPAMFCKHDCLQQDIVQWVLHFRNLHIRLYVNSSDAAQMRKTPPAAADNCLR